MIIKINCMKIILINVVKIKNKIKMNKYINRNLS